MLLEELDYTLPDELIAQTPPANRDEARMLVLERRGGTFEHSRFRNIGRYLRESDLLVMNDTRVFPARLFARKESGGRVEMLMVRPVEDPPEAWLALIRAHHAPKPGGLLRLESGDELRIVRYERPGRPILESVNGRQISDILSREAALALPHYIRREPDRADFADYQTVYADKAGAVAAPTAGLHFTGPLLDKLRESGVRTTFITLHIGPGTFTPVRSRDVAGHTMEAEWYTIAPKAREEIGLARRTASRIIAVGSSSVRALESYAVTGDIEGFTGLFISPGFHFKLVDAMVTNFHMPRSTVLAMVMAFADRETILGAYREAIRRRYRFLSYGDSMLIL